MEENKKNEKAVLLFSGGIDSTFLAYIEAKKYSKIILLTYKVPGMIKVRNSCKNVKYLQKKFPNKFKHEIIDIRPQIKQNRGGVIKSLKDNFCHKIGYSWCLGCKINMHLRTIKYCCDNNINYVLDGSNKFDLHALEQYEKFKNYIKKIYFKNNIVFLSPHYEFFIDKLEKGESEMSLAQKIKSHLTIFKFSTSGKACNLKEEGFDLGFHLGSQYRSTQPSCLISLFFNLIRLPLKFFLKEEKYMNYVKLKIKDWS